MQRIHLIGVCGTAMATLAALLKRRGHDVRGSDQNVYPPMSDFLAAEGIPIMTGYAAEHIGPEIDLVVVGNAISRSNAELERVLERKIRYCSLPEAVRDHFLWGARSIVVAGTHGKTTTTSLTGWLLTHGRLDPTVLVGGIARHAVSPFETFGTADDADWQATDIESADGLTNFKMRRRGEPFGRFASPLLGVHNVRNAVAAIAVGAYVGMSPGDLADGLRAFKGIKRRLEVVGTAAGVTVMDDFAHHPTAVHETLSALRTGYPNRRIWAIFEPRSASSCRRVFQDDFARSFSAADEVVVAAVFRSSLPESERLSAE